MSPQTDSSRSRLPIVTLLLSMAALAVWVTPGAASALQYVRAAPAGGQWWRFFTCHWTHFSMDHLLWDVGTFTLLGTICERRNRAALLACIGISAALIPAVLWIYLPRVQTYRGLSGIDSALFILVAVDLLRAQAGRGRRALVMGIVLLLVLFIGKIAFESFSGRTVFVDSASAQMVPVPLAHLVGALAGFVGWASTPILQVRG
jgi:rhomboid family GlyGly-CTERM serine protease